MHRLLNIRSPPRLCGNSWWPDLGAFELATCCIQRVEAYAGAAIATEEAPSSRGQSVPSSVCGTRPAFQTYDPPGDFAFGERLVAVVDHDGPARWRHLTREDTLTLTCRRCLRPWQKPIRVVQSDTAKSGHSRGCAKRGLDEPTDQSRPRISSTYGESVEAVT